MIPHVIKTNECVLKVKFHFQIRIQIGKFANASYPIFTFVYSKPSFIREAIILRFVCHCFISDCSRLVSLSELNISTNDIEELPPSLGLLRHLRTIYADENLLEEIPPEVGFSLYFQIFYFKFKAHLHDCL